MPTRIPDGARAFSWARSRQIGCCSSLSRIRAFGPTRGRDCRPWSSSRLKSIATPELDRIERERRANLIDHHFERGHGLHGSVAAHRAGGDAARVKAIRSDVDFSGHSRCRARHSRATVATLGGKIGEAAAVQGVVSGKSDNLARCPIDPDPRANIEGVPLDPGLKLVEAVVGEPDGAIGKDHRRQSDIERERRVVASAEPAAAIGEVDVDVRRAEFRIGLAEQKCDRFRGFVGRLHADDERERLAARVVPRKPAFRLEKHRIDRLGVELTVQHQERRIVRRQLRAYFRADVSGFGIGRPGRDRQPRPDRDLGVLVVCWNLPGLTQPFFTGE